MTGVAENTMYDMITNLRIRKTIVSQTCWNQRAVALVIHLMATYMPVQKCNNIAYPLCVVWQIARMRMVCIPGSLFVLT